MDKYGVTAIVLLGTCAFYHVASQTITDAKNLRTDMFTTNAYDSKIRPIDNQSLAISKLILNICLITVCLVLLR